MHFPKSKPNSITYPSYKNFHNQMVQSGTIIKIFKGN